MKALTIAVITILLGSVEAYAQTRMSKDWVWDTTGGEYFFAATVNADGRSFGQYCYHENGMCYYLADLGVVCDENDEYPSLVNSSTGVISVTLICGHKFQGNNVFYIKPFDDINQIAIEANQIGFAVAMDEGTFKVVRFSLSGSNHAIEMMKSAAELVQQNKTKGKSSSNKKAISEEYL
jgi:hypothetical protein